MRINLPFGFLGSKDAPITGTKETVLEHLKNAIAENIPDGATELKAFYEHDHLPLLVLTFLPPNHKYVVQINWGKHPHRHLYSQYMQSEPGVKRVFDTEKEAWDAAVSFRHTMDIGKYGGWVTIHDEEIS